MSARGMPVLDLADLAPPAAAPRRSGRLPLGLGLLVLAVAFGAWAGFGDWRQEPTPQPVRAEEGAPQTVARLTVDDRAQILAAGAEAEARNAAIPFSASALPMGGFHLMAPANTAASALKCLTQAVYYEAATEPLAGRRAVAQVVLNRVRHPAYPKSVCGVVYQGSELSTGCQFSFTCDGSLLRAPMPRPWREAEQVAREALAGHVEAEVGTATHYHADYVLPRWAFEMDKIAQLGRHLFYRFEGTWGRPTFFAGAYNSREVIPDLNLQRLRARLLASRGEAGSLESFTPGLTVAPQITDRHAENDVGGRLDMTRSWRPSIPDPTGAGSRYHAIVTGDPASAPAAAAADVEAPQ